ncbi:hypothetical protein RclHR1_00200023 [Rhizophagus clarus]|uniref:Uncharacterized protein n=1 Tax=Rhizophagus clarus TaxID=94130 RepID=A0A2Z6QQM9_9GLOM|nr:hypothetical protein RclHR1_00200023 [Rhizophagus clarus]
MLISLSAFTISQKIFKNHIKTAQSRIIIFFFFSDSHLHPRVSQDTFYILSKIIHLYFSYLLDHFISLQ